MPSLILPWWFWPLCALVALALYWQRPRHRTGGVAGGRTDAASELLTELRALRSELQRRLSDRLSEEIVRGLLLKQGLLPEPGPNQASSIEMPRRYKIVPVEPNELPEQ